MGRISCPLELDRQRPPSAAIPDCPFIPADATREGCLTRHGARRLRVRSVNDQLRHRGLGADHPPVRIVVAERSDLVAGRWVDAGGHDNSLCRGLASALEIDVRCGNYPADRIAGLVGGLQGQDAGLSTAPDRRALSHLPSADLCILHDHALDSADLDAGSTPAGGGSYHLLPDGASPQGGAFLAGVWRRVRGLPVTSSVLASHSEGDRVSARARWPFALRETCRSLVGRIAKMAAHAAKP